MEKARRYNDCNCHWD